jgi:predicted negative regulator of RcsB-dependent stress response
MDDPVVVVSTVVVGLLLALVVWQAFSTWRARLDGRREAAFERLAHATTAAQQETVVQLKELSGAVSELNGRLAAVEALLRDVS